MRIRTGGIVVAMAAGAGAYLVLRYGIDYWGDPRLREFAGVAPVWFSAFYCFSVIVALVLFTIPPRFKRFSPPRVGCALAAVPLVADLAFWVAIGILGEDGRDPWLRGIWRVGGAMRLPAVWVLRVCGVQVEYGTSHTPPWLYCHWELFVALATWLLAVPVIALLFRLRATMPGDS